MQPGSAIGAAAIVDAAGNRITDSKHISAFVAKMRSAAERTVRDPDYAEGMVDDQITVEVGELGVTYGQGALITFSAEEALRAGYADHLANGISEVLDYLDASEYSVVVMELSLAEKVSRVLTHPIVQIFIAVDRYSWCRYRASLYLALDWLASWVSRDSPYISLVITRTSPGSNISSCSLPASFSCSLNCLSRASAF